MSDASVREATGHDWAHWLAVLDARGARDMDHAAIVRSLEADGIRPWWRQMLTVGYERMIGRRAMGQTCAGTFSANASRTIPGTMDTARQAWAALNAERAEYAGAVATGEPRCTDSANWRYWRVDLDDGSKVSVMFSDKPGGKATVAVNHDKLASAEAIAIAKAFWKPLLQAL
ncbi:MAG: hypothetical protein KDE15_12440 [Erythrobacter sp.]|nr:hypothetical protein [Erythrobacter sp.]